MEEENGSIERKDLRRAKAETPHESVNSESPLGVN